MEDIKKSRNSLLLILALALFYLVWQTQTNSKLVVYCAHDSVFAESILRDFEKKIGVRVEVKYDSEATKSLGLVERIIRDKGRPQCDVFWNNEMLGTLDLAKRGLLQPHKGTGWERIPARYRDSDGLWAGFGARMRVKIMNTGSAEHEEPAKGKAGHFAFAKPLYGTTLTHFSALWSIWGSERTKQWHLDARADGVQVANGNAVVRDLVAAGTAGAGWTDTDDFFDAKDAGKPVAALPVVLENGETICIPNTVAILKGANRPDLGRKFVDYLLSARTELALANSKARQIPLGSLSAEQQNSLPPEVRDLIPAALKGVPLGGLLDARNECLNWLKAEYLK
jgi:iron(III) transport system substrate-binding protein